LLKQIFFEKNLPYSQQIGYIFINYRSQNSKKITFMELKVSQKNQNHMKNRQIPWVDKAVSGITFWQIPQDFGSFLQPGGQHDKCHDEVVDSGPGDPGPHGLRRAPH
jgi:hypothetical protein